LVFSGWLLVSRKCGKDSQNSAISKWDFVNQPHPLYVKERGTMAAAMAMATGVLMANVMDW